MDEQEYQQELAERMIDELKNKDINPLGNEIMIDVISKQLETTNTILIVHSVRRVYEI